MVKANGSSPGNYGEVFFNSYFQRSQSQIRLNLKYTSKLISIEGF